MTAFPLSLQGLETRVAGLWAGLLPTSWLIAFAARTGLASPDPMSYFCGSGGRLHGCSCWGHRPINLPCLLAHTAPADLARLMPHCLSHGSWWQGTVEGVPSPCPSRAGGSHRKASGVFGGLSVGSIFPVAQQSEFGFSWRRGKAASAGARAPRGQGWQLAPAKLTPAWHTGL